MLKLTNFTGIDNVADPARAKKGALSAARNVDIDNSGQILRRQGYTLASVGCRRNLWQGDGFLLATSDGGDLVAVSGGVERVVYPGMGHARVWYANLPDGRTAFSNGLDAGTTDGVGFLDLGVEPPHSAGDAMAVQGALFAGRYQWWTTHVRTADGQESGTRHGGAVDITDGGILITGLPAREGFTTNVYLSGADGDTPFFAGNAQGPAFSFMGHSDTLTTPCRTQHMTPLPAGTVLAFWRGRLLVASGAQLLASRQYQSGLHDPRRDFKQFEKPITGIVPVTAGIFVGTENELAFLRGDAFDALTYQKVMTGNTVLGSAISVPGEKLKRGDGASSGSAMLCINGGRIVAGYEDGTASAITEGRYITPHSEVFATFRESRGIPQYIAIPA